MEEKLPDAEDGHFMGIAAKTLHYMLRMGKHS